MEVKPDFERLRRAAECLEPDRVPLCEVLIEYPIQSQFLGREVDADDIEAQVEFWANAGYDFLPITVGMMTPGRVTDESVISRVIRDVLLRDSEGVVDEASWNLEYRSFITDRADFENFPWDMLARPDFTKLHQANSFLPDGMKVIAVSGKIFTLTWMLMGFNHFAMSLITDEQLVADVFRKVAEIQFSALETILSLDFVGGVWAVDDLAFNTGPLISPQSLRDHVFPWYREMASRCRREERLFLFHSDGDLNQLMDDLIDLGVDILQPIDPTCMDIVEVNREYGDRICLAGNVANELLQTGDPADVEDRVKELLHEVAPGGGYCLGSGNSVPAWARFENYSAMRDAALEHGTYPITV